MEKFKGIKGPWYVREGEMQYTGLKELVIAPLKPINHKGGYRLICCISTISDCDSEDVANAQLIAHAPEMLEKLTECKTMFSKGKRLTTTDMAMMVDEITYLLTRATNI